MNLMALEGVKDSEDAWVGGRIQKGERSWTDGYAKNDIRYFPVAHGRDGCTGLYGQKSSKYAGMMEPTKCG